jgi:hypothetical protein
VMAGRHKISSKVHVFEAWRCIISVGSEIKEDRETHTWISSVSSLGTAAAFCVRLVGRRCGAAGGGGRRKTGGGERGTRAQRPPGCLVIDESS